MYIRREAEVIQDLGSSSAHSCAERSAHSARGQWALGTGQCMQIAAHSARGQWTVAVDSGQWTVGSGHCVLSRDHRLQPAIARPPLTSG